MKKQHNPRIYSSSYSKYTFECKEHNIEKSLLTMVQANESQRVHLSATALGSIKSDKKAKASKDNGKKGGRPKKVDNLNT